MIVAKDMAREKGGGDLMGEEMLKKATMVIPRMAGEEVEVLNKETDHIESRQLIVNLFYVFLCLEEEVGG